MQRVAEHGAAFVPLAADMADWRERAGTLRPAALLEAVIKESGLLAHFGLPIQNGITSRFSSTGSVR